MPVPGKAQQLEEKPCHTSVFVIPITKGIMVIDKNNPRKHKHIELYGTYDLGNGRRGAISGPSGEAAKVSPRQEHEC
jgi:hypothetical protein